MKLMESIALRGEDHVNLFNGWPFCVFLTQAKVRNCHGRIPGTNTVEKRNSEKGVEPLEGSFLSVLLAPEQRLQPKLPSPYFYQ